MKKIRKSPYQKGTVVPISIISKRKLKKNSPVTKETEYYTLKGKITNFESDEKVDKYSDQYKLGYRYLTNCSMEVEEVIKKKVNEEMDKA